MANGILNRAKCPFSHAFQDLASRKADAIRISGFKRLGKPTVYASSTSPQPSPKREGLKSARVITEFPFSFRRRGQGMRSQGDTDPPGKRREAMGERSGREA
jgi:hypothetical protein